MKSNRKASSGLWLTVLFLAIVMAVPRLAGAQDPSQDPGKSGTTGQNASKPTTNSDNSAPATPMGLSWSNTYINQIGTSGVLAGNPQGIGWGGVYIPMAELSGIVENFGTSSAQPGGVYTEGVLRGTVVYDHRVGSGQVAIQYEPSLAFADGQIIKNFSNQNTNLDVLIYARPRWNIRFGDSFRYYYSQQSIGFPFFDVNPVSGGSITNSFLDGPSRWLSNLTSFSVGYAISARSSITIVPRYLYAESGTGASLDHANSYGGDVSWNYLASERQTFGVYYTAQLIHEGFTSPSPATDTVYNTLAGTVGRKLSATWFVRGGLGATTSAQSNGRREWQTYGSFGLVKQFARSSLGINYSRGDTLVTGLISSQYSDRADISYKSKIAQRFDWGVGGGYLRQTGSSGSDGWYGEANAQFLLAPRSGLFSTFHYTHKYQHVTTANLYDGDFDLYSFGVLWQPGRLSH